MKQYRNDITEINRRLDTAQIHMKPDDWDIQELRGETLRLQYRSFMSHCPEQIQKREPYFNQALMTPQYLVNFSLAKKDPLYNYCWEELSKQYPKTQMEVAVDCVEGIGFALAAATDYVYTGTKRIDIRRPFNEAVREIYHSLARVQGKGILFTNQDKPSTHLVHWIVTDPPSFQKGNIISGNDPLMLKCYLKGELTFEAMLKDSRYN
jgi:hypothetical protein